MAVRQPSGIWRAFRNVGLLAVIAALAAANWQIWTTPYDIRPTAPGNAAPPALAAKGNSPGLAQKPARAKVYTETLTRPIFRADRKPFVAVAEPPPPPAVEEAAEATPPAPPAVAPQGMKLVGIMRDGDGQDRAFVRSAQTPATSWLKVGDEIDGWHVSAITTSGVTLSANEARVTLELYPASGDRLPAETP